MATDDPSTPTGADDAHPVSPPPARRGIVRRLLSSAACLLKFILFAALIGWAAMAIYYSNLPSLLRPIGAAVFVLAAVLVLWRIKSRAKRLLAFAALFVALLLWWFSIPPSNTRDWQADVAVLPWAEIAGDRVTVHNVRNCDYRSDTDYTLRHDDRTYDLAKLRSADLFLVHWGSPHIAHTMMSFGFGDSDANADYLCFSIETRKEKGEDYSAVRGFFRQYELTYVAADERDLVGVRTNVRNEQVYLYRLKADPAVIRGVFLGYLKAMTSLRDRPEWYNAATGNCTTNIRGHTRPYAGNKRWDWRFLVNGHLDELIYERGAIDGSLPLAQLNDRCLVNDRAKAAGNAPDFSRRIRQGIPGTASTDK